MKSSRYKAMRNRILEEKILNMDLREHIKAAIGYRGNSDNWTSKVISIAEPFEGGVYSLNVVLVESFTPKSAIAKVQAQDE